MANLYAGDRVYSIDDGYYGVIVQNFSDMGYEYANIELESKITERYTRTKRRLIKLHPEDQPDGQTELKECTDQDKTIAELQDAVEHIQKNTTSHARQIDELSNRVAELQRNRSALMSEIDKLTNRIATLENARQQDVENSRQMKEMLMNMVKQWEAEDEQERK